MNLNWAIKGELATSSLPTTGADAARLKRLGFGAVLSLHPVSQGVARLLQDMGILQASRAVEDFSAPGLEQMDRLKALLDEWQQLGKPILIHCYMGVGRCRTVACAYLTTKGYTPAEAFDLVGFPETMAQIAFVEQYCRHQAEISRTAENA